MNRQPPEPAGYRDLGMDLPYPITCAKMGVICTISEGRMAERSCPLCKRLDDLRSRRDPGFIHEFPNSFAVLGQQQLYRGSCMLISKKHAAELHLLPPPERVAFCAEMMILAEAIFRTVQPDKLNYELLGNLVPHLHWHIFPRVKVDKKFSDPIWVRPEKERLAVQLSPEDRSALIALLREHLPKSPV